MPKVTIPCGKFRIEVEANTPAEAFQAFTVFSEAFSCGNQCGKCGSDNTIPQHRCAQGQFNYYYYRCLDCQAILDLGQRKDNDVLYPKRVDKNGNKDTENHGWYRWQERNDAGQQQPKQEAAPQPAPAASGSGDVPF